MVVHSKIKSKDDINIYFVGDIHIGVNTCQKDSFENTIKIIKNDPKAKVVFMGDNLDLVLEDDTRRYNKFCADKSLPTAEHQYKYFIKTIKPIKDKIIGILSGNHEMVYAKFHQDEFTDKQRDHSERAAKELGVKYLNDMTVLAVQAGKKKYTVVAAHGCGFGTTLSSHVKKMQMIIEGFEITPDVMCMGHVHNLQTVLNPKMNFEFKSKVKWLGLTGSYYKTYIENNMNYASSNLYAPNLIGSIMFTFSTNGNITDGKIIYA